MRKQTKQFIIIVCLVALLIFQLPITAYAASDYDFALKDRYPYFIVAEGDGGYIVYHLTVSDLSNGATTLMMKFHTLNEALHYLETGDDSASWGNNETTLSWNTYFKHLTILYGNVIQCSNPPPYAQENYEYLGTYPLETWMVIQTFGPDGQMLTFQIPAALFQFDYDFNKFVVVKRYSAEYGRSVYSLCYSDWELKVDEDKGILSTDVLYYTDADSQFEATNWQSWLSYFPNLYETAFKRLGDWLYHLMGGDLDARGMILTIDFDYLEDALHALQHISTYDATYLGDLGIDAWGHVEPCLGFTFVSEGGLDYDEVALVAHTNAADGAGLYDFNGKLIRPSDNFYELDPNGNPVLDADGNPIQKEVGVEDIPKPTVAMKSQNIVTAFKDAWRSMNEIVNYLEFLPDKIYVQIQAFFGTAFVIAGIFLALKVAGVIF